jgi:hypothetical protein
MASRDALKLVTEVAAEDSGEGPSGEGAGRPKVEEAEDPSKADCFRAWG